MSRTSMILSALMMLALVIVIAPNIIAMNRGKVLRNVALWLATFCVLALIYKNFGPESEHPLFQGTVGSGFLTRLTPPPPSTKSKIDEEVPGDRAFTPPKD